MTPTHPSDVSEVARMEILVAHKVLVRHLVLVPGGFHNTKIFVICIVDLGIEIYGKLNY